MVEKKLDGHLVGFGTLNHWQLYENYIYYDELKKKTYNAYADTPSKEMCDQICAELSGEVITYHMK